MGATQARRLQLPAANAEDRIVRYRNGTSTTQRNMPVSAGMSYADTQLPGLISYLPANDPRRFLSAPYAQNFVTGTVDAKSYLKWLRKNGYDLGNLQAQ